MQQKHISELTNKEMTILLRLIKRDLTQFCKFLEQEREYVRGEDEFDNDHKDFFIKNSLQNSKWIGNLLLLLLGFYEDCFSMEVNEAVKKLIEEDIKWADKAIQHQENIGVRTITLFKRDKS